MDQDSNTGKDPKPKKCPKPVSSEPTLSRIWSLNKSTQHPGQAALVVPIHRRPHTQDEELSLANDTATEQPGSDKAAIPNQTAEKNTAVCTSNDANSGKPIGTLIIETRRVYLQCL